MFLKREGSGQIDDRLTFPKINLQSEIPQQLNKGQSLCGNSLQESLHRNNEAFVQQAAVWPTAGLYQTEEDSSALALLPVTFRDDSSFWGGSIAV